MKESLIDRCRYPCTSAVSKLHRPLALDLSSISYTMVLLVRKEIITEGLLKHLWKGKNTLSFKYLIGLFKKNRPNLFQCQMYC